MNVTRYPLCWPANWKRETNRTRAQFGKVSTRFDAEKGKHLYAGKSRLSIEDSFGRIEYELERFGVDVSTVNVSTNLRVNMRGMPTGRDGEPGDPGAAVYWTLRGLSKCMAIDRYDRVADNLAAIAATLDALRAIERFGGGSILERAFVGFAELPAPRNGRDWRKVLGFSADHTPSIAVIETQFRGMAKLLHPDKETGDTERMIELNAAHEAALAELGG